MWGGPQDVFLSFEFRVDRSPNLGATGVKNRPFPLTRHIAYITACSYRTSRDVHVTNTVLYFSTQLNSSLLKHGSRMAKRDAGI